MDSDGRPPAHTCACCGQGIRTTARLTLRVETPVLELCNAAFADAEAHGHAEVDVAHLIVRLAHSPEAVVAFWQHDLDPAAMAHAAARWMDRSQRRRGAEPVTASAQLRALLTRAEDHAARSGRTHASLADLAAVLAGLSGAADDASARPAGSSLTGSQPEAASLRGLITTTPPQGTAGYSSTHGTRRTPASAPAQHTAGEDRATLAALLARLDRQEAELAGLRAALDQNAHGRTRNRSTAGTRVSSRAQTYDPDFHTLSTQSTPDRVFLRRSLRRRQEQSRRNRMRSTMGPGYGPRTPGEAAASRSWSPRRANAGSGTGHGSGTGAGYGRNREREATEAEDDLNTTGAAKRFYLALDDHIERAPSIGPKTAGRLIDAGIATVRDLLAADPEAVAASVPAKFITAQRIRDWQAQARLVCTVPFLRGTHAQLLVGAGYPDLERIVAADPSILCAAILKFAATRDGQSVLRSAPPPDVERVLRWLVNAADAEPARAAA